MKIQLIRVVGMGATVLKPAVVAIVDDLVVKWNPGRGWTTDCTCPDLDQCAHINAVADLLAPRVLGDAG